jgi:sugar lactone lactonase YvrE
MRRRLFQVLVVLVVLAVLVAGALGFLKFQYGRGVPYPGVGGEPVLPPGAVTTAAVMEFPTGCVTVSDDGRVFFDTHPFAAPGRFVAPKVFEVIDGVARAWPSEEAQSIFIAPFGLTADRQGRLWFTEPATLDRGATRLLAFDRNSGELVFEHLLPPGEARFAQDLRVSPDGRYVVLADTGIMRFTPGQLLVFDIEARRIVRRFQHPTLNAQDWVIRRWDGAPHRTLWGLINFQVGVDGITFSRDGKWLWYATMSHDTLYRLSASVLLDPSASDDAVAATIQAIGPKPLSDGIAATPEGSVLVTDIENGGVVEIAEDGTIQRLTASPDVIWADSVEVAPDGSAYLTDSAIPYYLPQDLGPPPRAVLDAGAPYRLYRIDRRPEQ